ncbi:MAG: hypothetical protein AAF491_09345 [Verrucomicrobiota bacterium]
MRFVAFITLSLLGAAVSSCAKSKREIALAPEMKAKVDAYLEEMREIAGSLPEDPFEKDLRLDPVPIFGVQIKDTNTLVARAGQLANMESSYGFKDESLLDFFHGGASQRFLHDRYSVDVAPEGYEEELNRFLERRYVIAIAQESYVPPKIVEEEYFEGGTATVRAGLFDRTSREWIVVIRIVSAAPDRVEFEATERDFKMYADQFVRGRLRGEILNEMELRLNEATGGRLDL